ncbi:lipoyl(octanoyl) transferase LipB [Streptomyces sp. A7024]|uniref:Octanoyltransferase n=2 Tax=Streptomyces coryli TaxID=1128680 RepID=A0A6G4TXF5_9ACTN|nr:lipoyl(octanoyl) transferase LipB [Streptomyces coryli]NGN63727.1 lipoyl(octanoyl) transferase LipB [Streptomyces coryli]
MRGWVGERQRGEAGDRLFLLSHPPVITYSAHTGADELPSGGDIPLVEVDRGGHATYHGPGQLIGYLIVGVRDLGPGDFVRRTEVGLIKALDGLGFPAVRRETPPGADSLVGVWTPDGRRKLVSIGMRIRGGVSSHGFALNVDPDLAPFSTFAACRLPEVPMTSLAELAAEAGRPAPGEAEVRDAVAAALTEELKPA